MKKLALAALLLVSGAAVHSQAWAQTAAAAAELASDLTAFDTETVYSEADRQADESTARRTVRAVVAPVETLGNQYARWKQPVCFNVYGLSALAKYVVERRMKDIAQEVGAPLDRDDPCVPNVAIIFTSEPQATLQSIAQVRNYLVPWAGMIRSRLREAQPVQAWYSTVVRGVNGRKFLQYDGYNDEEPTYPVSAVNSMSNGVETEMGTVTILVDTKAVMGLSLGSLADHFAMLSLAQARFSRGCKDVDSIANLLHTDCNPAATAQAMTLGDRALLAGLYKTSDDRLQRLHQQRVIGNMREILEAQLKAKERPANLGFER